MSRLIFLHGFLGSKEDWQGVIDILDPKFECIACDFADPLPSGHLIGYSMGGRRALSLKREAPEKFGHVIAFSAHPGLATKEEKRARWQTDLEWIEKLQTLNLSDWLDLWYAQPLFDSLRKRPELFEQVLKKRAQQDPSSLIETLKRYSLAHQDLLHLPSALYVCGKEDLKYVSLYRTLPPFIRVRHIEGAGHALHLEHPEACARIIEEWII
jgi:2-succinyl-6-hydroxy-2,4-cyclohexadiene-1-carboxylate synthase